MAPEGSHLSARRACLGRLICTDRRPSDRRRVTRATLVAWGRVLPLRGRGGWRARSGAHQLARPLVEKGASQQRVCGGGRRRPAAKPGPRDRLHRRDRTRRAAARHRLLRDVPPQPERTGVAPVRRLRCLRAGLLHAADPARRAQPATATTRASLPPMPSENSWARRCSFVPPTLLRPPFCWPPRASLRSGCGSVFAPSAG
jgi:hypothetical protein